MTVDRVVVRAYLLIARFGIQKKLLQNRNEEHFTRFQRFFSERAALVLFIIGVIINSVSYLIISLRTKNYYSFESIPKYICLYERPVTDQTLPFYIIYNLLIIIAVVILQKHKIRDNLSFKLELFLNAALLNLVAVFVFPALYLIDDPRNLIQHILLTLSI